MGAVVVVGSLNRDVYALVPELPAPGQTVLALETYEGLGGKGANQAVAAARLGAEVSFVGAVGTDGGPDERFALRELGVDVSEVQSVSGTATGAAYVVVAKSGENQIVVSPGANAALDVEVLLDSLEVRLRTGGGAGRTVVVAQGELGGEVVERVVATVRRMDAELPERPAMVLNLAPVVPVSLEALRSLDVLVVNEVEGAALAGTMSGSAGSDDGATVCRELTDALGVATIVTLGGAGAVLVEPGSGRAVVQPAAPVASVVDTTGAGDCFVGALVARLAAGRQLSEALGWAVAAAACAVGAPGTTASFPDAGSVERRLVDVPPQHG